MNEGKFLPPAYLFASLASMVLLSLFIPLYSLIPYPWNATGLLPLALGVALNASTDNALKKHDTTVKPFEVSTTLITTGVFNFSRNPMYLGMVLILIGAALLLGTLSSLIIIPVFAITIDRIFIVAEEKMLDQRFGDEWKQYKTNVRRWI
jgi:protein-S-isoprenylcysteine O-methyltransferase Ste14